MIKKKNLLLVSSGQKTDKVPIWFMRQAGRYLPEYLKLRSNFANFIDFCLTPDAASEATLQPLRRFDIDAAIVFADILLIPHALGIKVNFVENIGPIINFLPNEENINSLGKINYEAFKNIQSTLKLVRKEIDSTYKTKTLIGFCGAPWTVAAYVIEGKTSKDFLEVRKFAIKNEGLFQILIDKTTEATIEYLDFQIKGGAEVVKIFDSWSGVLPNDQFKKWVIKPTKKIVTAIKKLHPNVPIIAFPRKSGLFYQEFANEIDSEVIALDQYTDILWAIEKMPGKVLQGNLDNLTLAYDSKGVEKQTKKILNDFNNTPFIFNLGHGIIPDTPIENVERLIKVIRDHES